MDKLDQAEINYQTYVQSFFNSDRNDGSYTYDLLEVTASRQVLRFLERFAASKDPQRAEFFRKMRELSIKNRMVVIPRIPALILDKFYIRTGYKSQRI